MASYTSGSIYFNGLTDTDFDTMISQLKEIEMTQANRLAKWKSEWQLRMAAFEELRTELVSLQSTLNKMNNLNAFMTKTCTSSDYAISAKATADAVDGSYVIEVDQVAKNGVASIKLDGITSKTDVINNTSDTQYFTYEYAGKELTVAVPPQTTVEGLQNLINNNSANPGVKASLVNEANGITFQLQGNDVGAANSLSVTFCNVEAFTNSGSSDTYTATIENITATDFIYTDPGKPQSTFNFSHNGVDYSIDIYSGVTTYQDLATAISTQTGGAVTVDFSTGDMVLTANDGNHFSFEQNEFVNDWQVSQVGGWQTQEACNAKVKLNDWPQGSEWYEFETNTIEGLIEGVTFTINDETDRTVLTVETDLEGITENVQTFLDSVNSVRTKIQELTDWNETKQVLDPEYADNQFEMQKGSILTGNYGVQLISTQLKQLLAGTPAGFQALVNPNTPNEYGDVYSTLAQLGIKTDSDKGSDTYGMLIMVQNSDVDKSNYSGLPSFEDCLKKDPQAVAEFFALAEKGVSDSMDFSYHSHVGTVTDPGSYVVEYEFDASGNFLWGKINGKEAKYDPVTNQLSIVRSGPQSTSSSVASGSAATNVDGTWQVVVHQEATNASDKATVNADPHTDEFNSGYFEVEYHDKDGVLQSLYYDFTADHEDWTLAQVIADINSQYGKTGLVASYSSDGELSIFSPGTGDHNYVKVNTDVADLGAGSWNPTGDSGTDAIFDINDGKGNPIKTGIKNATGTYTTAEGVTIQTGKVGTASISCQTDNPADGLVVVLHNFSAGKHGGDPSSTVRIKQGLVNGVLGLLNGPHNAREEGMLGEKGALGILKSNYQTIIDNINTKIDKENTRIEKWERMMRQRFSRLQATITTYDGLNSTLESLIGQLSTS